METDSTVYVCLVCGWEYHPERGDPDGDVLPGTPFSALPEAWHCPVCGAEKSHFEALDAPRDGAT